MGSAFFALTLVNHRVWCWKNHPLGLRAVREEGRLCEQDPQALGFGEGSLAASVRPQCSAGCHFSGEEAQFSLMLGDAASFKRQMLKCGS